MSLHPIAFLVSLSLFGLAVFVDERAKRLKLHEEAIDLANKTVFIYDDFMKKMYK